MKKLSIAFILAVAIPLLVMAEPQPQPQAKKSVIPPIALDLAGAVVTQDFDDSDGLGSIGLEAALTPYLALGVETQAEDFTGRFLDGIAASVRYNILTKTRSTPYLFAGWNYGFEDRRHGIHFGVGVRHRVSDHAELFFDVRIVKPLDGVDVEVDSGSKQASTRTRPEPEPEPTPKPSPRLSSTESNRDPSALARLGVRFNLF